MAKTEGKKEGMTQRRKGDAAIQREVETQEEWEEMMAKEGLWVIDVFQEWAGPCNAMAANFRRIKNELADDLLNFATAKADSIEFLSRYRGHCEPCFLYFAGGVLVAVVHGANAPVILRTLTEQLKAEHQVLDGKAERRKIKDPLIAAMEEKERLMREEAERQQECQDKKKVTVAIIKPDAVQADRVDEILEQMKNKGLEIVAREERHLTEEEAREFYKHLQDEEYFEDLITFMTSGPCHVMVLTKGSTGSTVVADWRNLIGPTDVELAKEQHPECLRARFGTNSYMNALHGSDSPETAAREMAFFFPDLAVPSIAAKKRKSTQIQRTLALIRPDAFRTKKDEILEKIHEAGFRVAMQREMQLTKAQAEEFYKEHKNEAYFSDIVANMTSGPLLALGLAREDAISSWREMLGPKEVNVAKREAPESLRAMYTPSNVTINQLHGSDSPNSAQRELNFFFPVQQTIACIKPDAFGTKDAIISKIHEAGFKIAARVETTITHDVAEKFYGDLKDAPFFSELVDHMCSGPTMFMVLSQEDAVAKWRDTIGPTDPLVAKHEAPDSLRAHFGSDILKNAVHGSSDLHHVQQCMDSVFGPLEFDSEGNATEPSQPRPPKPPAKESKEPLHQDKPTNEENTEMGETEGEVEGILGAEGEAEGEAAGKKSQEAVGEVQEAEEGKGMGQPSAEPGMEQPVAEAEVKQPTAVAEMEKPAAEPEMEHHTAEPEMKQPTTEPEMEQRTAEPEMEQLTAEQKMEQLTVEPEIEQPAAEPGSENPVAAPEMVQLMSEPEVEKKPSSATEGGDVQAETAPDA